MSEVNAPVHRVAVDVGGTEIGLETGKLAKQASGAVVVTAGETVVLATATAGNERDVDFLPLTVRRLRARVDRREPRRPGELPAPPRGAARAPDRA